MKPKKKKVEEVGEFNLRSLINEVNSLHGEGTIMLASEANLDITWLSSGCFALDFATGGGFPESRISQIVGPESSGKTTVSLKTAASFQSKYKKGIVIYLDVEKTFDKRYAAKLGVALDRVLIVSPDSGEQGVDVAMLVLKQKIDILMIVDSIAAMTPAAEAEASMQDNFMGLHPRLINRFMRICTARMKHSLADPKAPKTTVIALNQLREKIGVMFGDPEITPGGRGKDFAASLTLKLFSSGSNANKIEEDVEVNGVKKKRLFGRNISFLVKKNKCGSAPFETGEFTYFNRPHKGYAAYSFNNAETAFEAGLFHNVISRSDSTGAFSYDGSFNSLNRKRKNDFVADLQADDDTLDELYSDILQKLRNPESEETEEETEETEE